MSNGYKPSPLDLSDIKLTPGQELLVDKLAENAHNVWAKDRIKQGWTYGIQQVHFFMDSKTDFYFSKKKTKKELTLTRVKRVCFSSSFCFQLSLLYFLCVQFVLHASLIHPSYSLYLTSASVRWFVGPDISQLYVIIRYAARCSAVKGNKNVLCRTRRSLLVCWTKKC